MEKYTYIDLTRTFQDSMPVFPGKIPEPAKLYQEGKISEHGYNSFVIEAGLHVGTHMDTPLHMMEGKEDISGIPIHRLFGRGRVIRCLNQKEITLDREILQDRIEKDDIVLFCTGHDAFFGLEKYFEDYPVLSEEFADFLAEKKVNMVGFDTPSPDRPPFPVHKKLFKAGILILENLTNIRELPEFKHIEICALPWKTPTDAAPVRVIAKVYE